MSGNIGSATFALRVDATAFELGLRRAEQQATQITGKIGNLFKGGLAVGLGINTFNTGLVATRRALDAAAEGVVHFNSTLDDTKATFVTFLGNVDAANEKVS